jgi:putative flippase GtrA
MGRREGLSEMEGEGKGKKISGELLRFLVSGIVCTVIDYLCQIGILNIPGVGAWPHAGSMALAYSAGYVISGAVNFILSTYWVFQNVDKTANVRSQKAWWAFFFLGIIGFLIGFGIQELGGTICRTAWDIDITQVRLSNVFSQSAGPFWAFSVVFAVKTCITLVYNYLSRKNLIYKAPKESANPSDSPKG